MSGKIIQEKFGQDVMDLVASFAKADLRTPSFLEANEFAHIGDPGLKLALAETLYGARWLYKLGLSLWVEDHEFICSCTCSTY